MHNGAAGIAKGFQRADLQALLLDHTGHGGRNHQRRHKEEKHRERRRDGGQLVHIGLKGMEAGVFAAVPDVPDGSFQLVQLCLAVLDLGAGVRQLLLCLRLGIGVLCLAVCQLLLVFLDFALPVCQLTPGGVQLPLGVQQLALGVAQFLHFFLQQPIGGVQLGARIVQLLQPALVLLQPLLKLHQPRQRGGKLIHFIAV